MSGPIPRVELHPVTEADLPFVRRLRNLHRESYLDTAEITEEEQRRWFAEVPTRYLAFYVVWRGSVPVGTVATKAHPRGVEVGNTALDPLCPHALRHNAMYLAVQQLMRDDTDYIAFVKPSNLASRLLTERMGYVVESADDTVITYVRPRQT